MFEIRTNDKSADSFDRGAITNSKGRCRMANKKMALWIRRSMRSYVDKTNFKCLQCGEAQLEMLISQLFCQMN